MAQALLAAPSKNFTQKTLGAQLLAGATTMTLNNTTDIPNLPGVCVVDRIDTTDTETPNAREVIKYTGTSGSTLTGLTRNADSSGSDQDHAINAIVEFVPDVLWADAVYDALTEVVVASTGALDTTKVVTPTGTQTLTNKTLTAPQIGGDADLDDATGNLTVAGADPKRGIYIPAAGMFAATTTGAATGQIETSTNKINAKVFDFDQSTEEYVWFTMPAPSYWDLSTVTAEFHWTAASGTGNVIWGIAGLARSNDDALDTALGTAVTVTDTLIAANDEHLSADSGAITVGGTPAKDDYLFFRIYRDADAGGDTLDADARLLGVTIRFGRGQYNDV